MKKILIGQLARYGDCLYATVLASQIKYDYPDSHVTWAIATKFLSILENNPYIDAIWEIKIDNEDYYCSNWNSFEKEALKRKAKGEFDEIIFSQIPPHNDKNFNGTIRSTILQSYPGKITVPLEPIVVLSDKDVEEVELFVKRNNLKKYKKIILFECEANSGQSKITKEIALRISNKIISEIPDIAVIISTSKRFVGSCEKIIDGSVLAFKHNAELTKYCDLLIGCSSGITWLATCGWAKKMPMIQILDKDSLFFAGVSYDFHINGLNAEHIIEIVTFSDDIVVDCVKLILDGNFTLAKNKYHEEYKVSYNNFAYMNKSLISRKMYLDGFKQVIRYKRNHSYLSLARLLFYYSQNLFGAFCRH